jgi:ribosome recycling factor
LVELGQGWATRMLDDTRKAMVKMIKVEAEAARVSVRNARKDAMAAVKRHPSEDERKRLEKQVINV